MKRKTQLPPLAYGQFLNRMLLGLYRSSDFPTRLRLLTSLERFSGSRRLQARTRYGFVMAVDREDLIQRSVLNDGVWEDECSEAIRWELRPEDVFFDVGSNVGYHSLLALATGVRKVVAFDPDPLNCSVFKLNLMLNNWMNGECLIQQCGVSDQEGAIRFYRSTLENIGRSGLTPRDVVDSFEIKTKTIDSMIERGEIPPPTVMKLDVEGWESRVLAGCRQLFQTAPPRCVFFENNPDCETVEREKIWSTLEEAGYSIFRVEEPASTFHNNYIAKLPS
jgi:FkbM family methyltransferase